MDLTSSKPIINSRIAVSLFQGETLNTPTSRRPEWPDPCQTGLQLFACMTQRGNRIKINRKNLGYL